MPGFSPRYIGQNVRRHSRQSSVRDKTAGQWRSVCCTDRIYKDFRQSAELFAAHYVYCEDRRQSCRGFARQRFKRWKRRDGSSQKIDEGFQPAYDSTSLPRFVLR